MPPTSPRVADVAKIKPGPGSDGECRGQAVVVWLTRHHLRRLTAVSIVLLALLALLALAGMIAIVLGDS